MKHAKLFSIIALIPFTILTVYSIMDVGVVGIFKHQFASSGGMQVFFDLVIAATLILFWLVPHAKSHNRNPLLYIVLTLIAGSYGPLLYLAFAKIND